MTGQFYTVFDTAIGCCGIAWGPDGIIGVQLPDIPPAETASRLARRFPAARAAAPPEAERRAIDGITALLAGAAIDLGTVELDLRQVPEGYRAIYAIARRIPPGATLTYGEIAERLGEPGAARLVGQAMGANPFPILMPCHRVLAAKGETGGFSAPGGIATKLRLLAIEGAPAARGPFSTEPATPETAPGLFDDALLDDWGPGCDAAVAAAHLAAADPALARLIGRVGPMRLPLDRRSSLFAALAEAIVYQQLTAKAAATIYGRVKALFKHAPDGPRPEQLRLVAEDALRGAGLSRNKILALRDLAAHAEAGEIPSLAQAQTMSDDAIIERLVAVRGVGRWTAQMLLIFRLGRPDVLPEDDYGLRKGYAAVFGGLPPDPRELAAAGQAWRPFRTAAAWYLWRAAELPKS
jgi:methylated-DNA-[protein]-cysteine S-methyltransferase